MKRPIIEYKDRWYMRTYPDSLHTDMLRLHMATARFKRRFMFIDSFVHSIIKRLSQLRIRIHRRVNDM